MLMNGACSSFQLQPNRDLRPVISLMKVLGTGLIAAAAWLSSQPAGAAITCTFRAPGTLTLAFGILDPSVGTTAMASLSVGTFQSDQVGDCTPTTQTMTLSAGNGQNFSGGSRRLVSGGNFIPYSIAGGGGGWAGTGPWTRNKPGNNVWRQIPVLTATIQGVDYQNAAAGSYSDTVILTISP